MWNQNAWHHCQTTHGIYAKCHTAHFGQKYDGKERTLAFETKKGSKEGRERERVSERERERE